MLSSIVATNGLVLPASVAPRSPAARMGCVDEFSISREIKTVRMSRRIAAWYCAVVFRPNLFFFKSDVAVRVVGRRGRRSEAAAGLDPRTTKH